MNRDRWEKIEDALGLVTIIVLIVLYLAGGYMIGFQAPL